MLRVLVFVAVALGTTALYADEAFPYLAFVTADQAEARSGPGMGFYATGKLQRGELVEVYRHDTGGWCAIRPPAGSFSWISSRYLKLKGDGLGEIAADGAVSIVGSQLTDAKDVWHVKLNRGEEVEVLATIRSNFGIWYKTAPPAGEFRWVSSRDVEPYTADPGEGSASYQGGGSAGWNTSTDPARMPHGPASVEEECNQIDLALSSMVCHPWQQWSFETLYDRAEGALAAARTTTERQTVKRLLSRLDRFEEIRHEQTLLAKEGAVPTDKLTAAPRGNATSSAAAGSGIHPGGDKAAGDKFAGRGTLVRVDSNRRGTAPRFAILNEKGEFLSYVVPGPRVDVSRYLNQEVGILGQRSYNADVRAPQLVAREITGLSGGKVR